MFPFFPFMYEEEQTEDSKQLPLYIEDIIYPPINEISNETENIIIINLF